MGNSDEQGMKRREGTQLSLFDDLKRRTAPKSHRYWDDEIFGSHVLIRKALDLPPDTVFIRGDNAHLYYVDEESVQQVNMNRVHAYFRKNIRRNQLQLSFTEDIEEVSVPPTNLVINLGGAAPPKRAEQLLLLILTNEEREYLVGDLAEEYIDIQSKHGERFAKVWYWKQVIASASPLIRKALRWGLLAWAEEWIRRHT
ncbi:MAG: permease prefix domain 2-containing transporter [Acidobacteriota bacterium]|nr:permease prefix domain 2-containing transporter [Acidobacteriota bacterium]